MPLPNDATVKDVIEKLEELQGLNQKVELASVIGTPASASDSVATQITKFQEEKDAIAYNINVKGVGASGSDSLQTLASKISEIVQGSSTANGSTTSSLSNSSLPFIYYDGSGNNSTSYVMVSGLSFKPSRIEVVAWLSGVYYLTEYNFALSDLVDSARTVSFGGNSRNISIQHYKGNTGNAYVTNSGFRLPVTLSGTTYSWKAYL